MDYNFEVHRYPFLFLFKGCKNYQKKLHLVLCIESSYLHLNACYIYTNHGREYGFSLLPMIILNEDHIIDAIHEIQSSSSSKAFWCQLSSMVVDVRIVLTRVFQKYRWMDIKAIANRAHSFSAKKDNILLTHIYVNTANLVVTRRIFNL